MTPPIIYGNLRHIMKSHLAFHDKAVNPDGSIIEMTIWELSGAVAGSNHTLKYSLFYGSPGTRIVGYDNERGKGDHKHIGEVEEAYLFTTVEQLVADFLSDVAKKRSKE
ncbi:MAG: DUF6516 family protein [Gallionella sp.]|nr:DUF6516 family protein [Gallionella sp.]MDP1941017.1 DUF6516 family protein [Gallionella sp.]